MSVADWTADARVVLRLLRGQARGGDHAANLQAFYAPQADRYDGFRARLLHGRQELVERLDIRPGERIVELGGGTGHGLELLASRIPGLARYDLVDLCPALLDVARRKLRPGWPIVLHEADAVAWRPAAPADAVFLSYALTMIPDWEALVDNAEAMLKPGGRIGIVDFHLPGTGSRWSNRLWQKWFAHDGVRLSERHLPLLERRFDTIYRSERRAGIPWLPGLRAPYYLFVGRRTGHVSQP
jgi:S-adenosylmethionine-diacylgycerolhomoserine-N-methlytransferase